MGVDHEQSRTEGWTVVFRTVFEEGIAQLDASSVLHGLFIKFPFLFVRIFI